MPENNIPKSKIIIPILVAFLAISVIIAVCLGISYSNNIKTIADLESSLAKVNADYKDLDKKYSALKIENATANNDLNWYKKYAVLVTTTGSKYHIHNCYHIEGSSLWIYNIEAAEGKGYTPCADCYQKLPKRLVEKYLN